MPTTQDAKNSLQSATSNLPSTSDVQSSLQSTLQSAKNSLPSAQDVKQSLPDTSAVSEQAQASAVYAQSQAQRGVDYVKDQVLPGQSKDEQIHNQGINYIKEQLPNQQSSKESINPIKDQYTTEYSSTSQLQGDLPLGSGGVPQVVSESQNLALASPEASANPEAVQEKSKYTPINFEMKDC